MVSKEKLPLAIYACIIRVVLGGLWKVEEGVERGVYPTPLAVHLARVGNENSFRGQSDCRFQPLTTHILPLTRFWLNTKFTDGLYLVFRHDWHQLCNSANSVIPQCLVQCISSASACPAKLFVRRRNHDFRQRNGELNHFSRMSRILLHFFCDTIPLTTFRNRVFVLWRKESFQKTRKPLTQTQWEWTQ